MVKEAAEELDIHYGQAKQIIKVYRRTGRTKKIIKASGLKTSTRDSYIEEQDENPLESHVHEEK